MHRNKHNNKFNAIAVLDTFHLNVCNHRRRSFIREECWPAGSAAKRFNVELFYSACYIIKELFRSMDEFYAMIGKMKYE